MKTVDVEWIKQVRGFRKQFVMESFRKRSSPRKGIYKYERSHIRNEVSEIRLIDAFLNSDFRKIAEENAKEAKHLRAMRDSHAEWLKEYADQIVDSNLYSVPLDAGTMQILQEVREELLAQAR